MNLKSKMIASIAALTLGLTAVSTPASAWWRGGGWHGGWGWHGGYGWHRGWGWGPAVGLGIVAGAVAGGAYYNSCIRYRPIYDQWGNYVGRRAVNVCY